MPRSGTKEAAAAELAAEREATPDEIEKAMTVYVGGRAASRVRERKGNLRTRRSAHIWARFLRSKNTAPGIPRPCHTCPPRQRPSQPF